MPATTAKPEATTAGPAQKKGPEPEEVIDLSGNYAEKAEELKAKSMKIATEAEIAAHTGQTRLTAAEDEPADKNLFMKMKQEWEALQQNPSGVDD